MRQVRIGVVIPAGPADDLLDTLDSVLAYTDPDRFVLIVDDTGGRLPSLPARPDVAVIPPPEGCPGAHGGLWVKIAAGYSFLLSKVQPGIVLRLDADALMLGPGLEAAAEARLSSPLGMIGSLNVDALGEVRDTSWAAAQLRRESGPLGRIRRPAVRRVLRELLAYARGNGYELGAHPLGGAYIHSGEAARAINQRGWFQLPIARSALGEDHIMALVTAAAGFTLGDFGGPQDPLAVRWRGLPMSPEELVARNKLVTHSVRFWNDRDETEIRQWFAQRRMVEPDR